MELRDLLVIDAESLSPAEAKLVVRDVIEVLTKGVSGEDQQPLKKLLIAAQEVAIGRKVGDVEDTIRADVLDKIQQAKARGDKRTARYLAESMVKRDVADARVAEHRIENPAQRFIDGDIAASEARQRARQQQRIEARAQELLRVNGSELDFSLAKARERATREVIGHPRYEDDVNNAPEKPNRQAILDAYKGRL